MKTVIKTITTTSLATQLNLNQVYYRIEISDLGSSTISIKYFIILIEPSIDAQNVSKCSSYFVCDSFRFYSPCKTEVSNKQDGTIGIVGHFNSQENHRRALRQANFTEHLRHVLNEYYNISCEEKDKHWNSDRSKKIQKNVIRYHFRSTINSHQIVFERYM